MSTVLAPGPNSAPDTSMDLDCSSGNLQDASSRSQVLPPKPNFAVIDHLPTDLDEEETATINRVPAVTLQLWQGLLKSRGFELDNGKLVRSPPKSQTRRSDPTELLQPVNSAANGKGKEKESVITTFRRTTSFAPIQKEPSIRQPFRRGTPAAAQGPEDAEGSGSKHSTNPQVGSTATLFAGYTFRLLGEARCPNVRSAIEGCSGMVTDDDTAEVDFIIVRLIRYGYCFSLCCLK